MYYITVGDIRQSLLFRSEEPIFHIIFIPADHEILGFSGSGFRTGSRRNYSIPRIIFIGISIIVLFILICVVFLILFVVLFVFFILILFVFVVFLVLILFEGFPSRTSPTSSILLVPVFILNALGKTAEACRCCDEKN